MSSDVQRKLTTILAADAEGYSREMDADEVRALGALRTATILADNGYANGDQVAALAESLDYSRRFVKRLPATLSQSLGLKSDRLLAWIIHDVS